MPQVAVVLSGCGVYDGTEVHEAAAALGNSHDKLIQGVPMTVCLSLSKYLSLKLGFVHPVPCTITYIHDLK